MKLTVTIATTAAANNVGGKTKSRTMMGSDEDLAGPRSADLIFCEALTLPQGADKQKWLQSDSMRSVCERRYYSRLAASDTLERRNHAAGPQKSIRRREKRIGR